MGLKSKILAATAALTVIGGAGAAGALTAPTANAATPSCGSHCIDVFSKQFGTYGHPAFVVDVLRQGEKIGQPVILFTTSNSDPAEDFTVAEEGKVSDFYGAGLVSAALDLHYGAGIGLPGVKKSGNGFPNDYAFEEEYAPYGVDSGLCVGLGSAAYQGEGVSLQPCGVSSNTVWVADIALTGQTDSCPANPLYRNEIPLINGSDTNFSHPFVLTYPSGKYPTDMPRPQLTVTNLTGFSQSGNGQPCGTNSISGPASNQLWAAVGGVLH